MSTLRMTVTFTNSDINQSFTLPHVRDVTWKSAYDKNVLVNATNKQGLRTQTITVTGFILFPIPSENTAAQQAFETTLRNIATGSLTYTGIDPIPSVRLISVDFDTYRGNPTAIYTVQFETYALNPHTHLPARIGNITLDPQPAVTDTVKSQAPDQRINGLYAHSFKFTGKCRGNLVEVNQFQADLTAEISNKLTVVITLSTGMYTVRPESLEFGSPEINETTTARQYTFDCSTYDNYSIEPYSYGETPITYGNITIDVVSSFTHEGTIEKTDTPNQNYLSDETINVNGKIYFPSYTAYQQYADILANIPVATAAATQDNYSIVSSSGNKLYLESVNISGFKRDANSIADNSIRYSGTVSATWKWRKGLESKTIGIGITALGITWFDIVSVNYSATIDEHGAVTSKGVSLNGRLKQADYNIALTNLGTKQDYDNNLKNLFITSVNFSSVDEVLTDGIREKLYTASVSANQLNSFTYYLAEIFNVEKTATTQFPHSPIIFQTVTNRSKSISNRYDINRQAFIVTSISLSLSGEVHQADNGSTAPTNPTAVVALFNEIDESIQLPLSIRGDLTTRHWFLNSISVGSWERFIHPILKIPYWQQSVSVSATVTYDLTGGGGGQDVVIDAESYVLNKQAPKFTTLQVLQYGIVFKRIGTEPATATITSERTYPSKQTYLPPPAGNPPQPNIGNVPGFPGPSDRILLKETQEARGLVNRIVQEYTAIKAT